jgi:hypothetical protein
MSRLHFIHGSSATPPEPGDLSLGLFDYQQHHDGGADNRHIGNGLDAHGPGIYAFPVEETTQVAAVKDDAFGYMGDDGLGSVLGLSLDCDPDVVPANELPADSIPVEEWEAVIEHVVNERRRLGNYYLEDFEAALYALADEWDASGERPSVDALEELVKDAGELPVNEIDPADYDSPEEWRDELDSVVETYDPANRIMENGGPDGIARHAVERSENLWSVLCYIQGVAAYESTGIGDNTYNKTLHFAVMNNVSEPDLLTYAKVNDGAFCVIFDVDALRVDYASQTLSDIDIPTLDALIDDIKSIYRDYGYEMSPQQLGVKFEQAALQHFGRPLSEDTQTMLQRGRSPESMYSAVGRSIINDMSPVYTREWARDDEAALRFDKQPDVTPEVPTSALEIGRELELSTPALRPR